MVWQSYHWYIASKWPLSESVSSPVPTVSCHYVFQATSMFTDYVSDKSHVHWSLAEDGSQHKEAVITGLFPNDMSSLLPKGTYLCSSEELHIADHVQIKLSSHMSPTVLHSTLFWGSRQPENKVMELTLAFLWPFPSGAPVGLCQYLFPISYLKNDIWSGCAYAGLSLPGWTGHWGGVTHCSSAASFILSAVFSIPLPLTLLS